MFFKRLGKGKGKGKGKIPINLSVGEIVGICVGAITAIAALCGAIQYYVSGTCICCIC